MEGKLFTLRQMNLRLWWLGFRYIPLLGATRSKILVLDEEKVVTLIKLRRKTKNHLGSMYFGALAMGADTAAGLHAFAFAEQMKLKLHFSFKDSKMDFLRRAESDIRFICKEGIAIKKAIKEAAEKKERINLSVLVEALDDKDELVSTMQMTLSLRVK
jgi:acyl-coenzyme A thioesterase PaaI-like protein